MGGRMSTARKLQIGVSEKFAKLDDIKRVAYPDRIEIHIPILPGQSVTVNKTHLIIRAAQLDPIAEGLVL